MSACVRVEEKAAGPASPVKNSPPISTQRRAVATSAQAVPPVQAEKKTMEQIDKMFEEEAKLPPDWRQIKLSPNDN